MQDATRGQRCLARLCELTDRQLLIDVWPVLLRIARLVWAFRRQPRSPQNLFRFETQLARLLWELGRRIVQWTLNQLEPPREEMPASLVWQGDAYRCKRLSPMRNLNCLFGKIRVHRWLYVSTEDLGLPALFPLELTLGLVQRVATPALADRVAQLAVDMTQRQVLLVLREQHQIHWGVKTLRKVVRATAEDMAPHRHAAQVALLLAWLKEAASQCGPRRITLAVGRDGLMLPLVGEKNYKEGATATVSVYSRLGKRLGTLYLGHMPEAGQKTLSDELTRLLQDVFGQWDGPALRLVFITDAGSHPTAYFHQVLSRMPDPWRPGRYLQWEWVVDYYHACKYLSELGEVIFGPGRAAHAWAAKMRRWLKEKPGGVFRVLRSAGALRARRGLVGEESDYESAYGFLRRHAKWMDYSGCRRRKVPIGSGVTEAACKIVFTQRFKCAGMKWGLEGGSWILTLRVIALSKIWPAVRDAMLAADVKNLQRTPALFYANHAAIPT